MGEAFIMGGGGGATIQRIQATDATSLTLSVTNPKRSKCLVFGVYTYTTNSYNGMGFLDSTNTYRCLLCGDVFDRIRHYVYYGSYNTTDEFEESITTGFFTRNEGSVTLTIGHTAGGYAGEMGTVRNNTIDIYVVDYD